MTTIPPFSQRHVRPWQHARTSISHLLLPGTKTSARMHISLLRAPKRFLCIRLGTHTHHTPTLPAQQRSTSHASLPDANFSNTTHISSTWNQKHSTTGTPVTYQPYRFNMTLNIVHDPPNRTTSRIHTRNPRMFSLKDLPMLIVDIGPGFPRKLWDFADAAVRKW